MIDNLQGAGPYRGFWSVTAHPVVLETAAALGPDFVCIDLQHGAEWSQLDANKFTALAHYHVPGLVRVPANDPAAIGRALDLGAAGVVVPLVNSAEDARAAVAACLYAPGGTRSFGPQSPRVEPVDSTATCIVQIETAEAVRAADEIAAVVGVDCLFVGPVDLGLSLGGVSAYDLLSVFDGSHPTAAVMQEALARVVRAVEASGKLAGVHCSTGAAAVAAEAHGFKLVAIATDVSAMRRDLAQQLAAVRDGAL